MHHRRLLAIACVLSTLLPLPGMSADSLGLSSDVVRRSAELAAAHLSASRTPTGAFIYEHDFLTGRDGPDDNIVRQAGAGYALGYYLTPTRDAAVADRLASALEYYGEKSVAVGAGLMVSSDETTDTANTGATALALLAALYHFEALGDPGFADVREKWAMALREAWSPDRGFRRGPHTDEVSAFYDGEAWLALSEYLRLFPGSDDMASVLEEADHHFSTRYVRKPNSGFNHWGLLAASVRYRATGSRSMHLAVARFAQLELLHLKPKFSPTSNTCPLVEGLAAAARTLRGDATVVELYGYVVARLEAEIAKDLAMQLPADVKAIDLGDGRSISDERLGDWAGSFRNERYGSKTRVDYTQHCLSAMQGYLLWQLEASP